MSTITFPTLTRSAPADLEFGLRSNTQIFESALSGQIQTRELPGARWTASFRFPNVETADAALLAAFLVQLRGQANRARIPVFGPAATPRGTWAGSPVVDNEVGSPTALQTGATLNLRGFSVGATVKKGDYFNVGSAGELKMATADATADGAGKLAVTFEPPLRASPADGTALVRTACVIPYALLADPHARWNHQPGAFSNFAFDFVESFA